MQPNEGKRRLVCTEDLTGRIVRMPLANTQNCMF